MKKVAVIMSTYNGERFIEEQIDSILSQEGVQVYLYIRDDGSSDRTIDIIKGYQENHNNIFLEQGNNLGVGNSFMELLYTLPDTYDYYAFSDQDDIWDKDKLLRGVNKLEETGAMLYGSNQECIDATGKTTYMRYSEDKNIHLLPIAIMSANQIAGCTFVFPKAFFKLLCERRPSADLLRLRIHDVWVAMVASVVGEIFYDKESFIKYRQHQNNVVGAKVPTKLDVIKLQQEKIRDKKKRNGRSLLAKEIIKCFPECINDDLLYACAEPGIRKNKVRIIRERNKIITYSGESGMAFICKVILGVF